MAKQVLPPDNESLKYLAETESSVDLIEKILDFSSTYEKLGLEKLSYFDVGQSFEATITSIPDLQSIKIVNDCFGFEVVADSMLSRLFYNLLDNSIKHGKNVNKIRLYFEDSRDSLKLVYEDDGVGVAKAEKEKIFGEGYGKGTGLGLHMMKIMCNVYGWSIQETGKQGKGAQFTITIPKTKAENSLQLH